MLRQRQPHRRHGPGLSRLRGHQRHGRPHRPGRRVNGVYDGLDLPALHGRERLHGPTLPAEKADLIYLCSPNNPTGAVATRERLEEWVAYALKHQAIIFYDAAYEAYITEEGVPHSIYEIPGARECAIEFRSFSKNGGFTGVRCAFTVVPKSLLCTDRHRRAKAAPPALEPPLQHEVQRRLLRHPARSRGALLRRRQEGGRRPHQALHGQRRRSSAKPSHPPASPSLAESTPRTSGSRARKA